MSWFLQIISLSICFEACARPIKFSRVRLPGDQTDGISVPPSPSDVATLLPGLTKPDSLILCYTGLTIMNLPDVGLVVAMLGEPEEEHHRQYSMLVGEFGDFFSCYHAFKLRPCFENSLLSLILFDLR